MSDQASTDTEEPARAAVDDESAVVAASDTSAERAGGQEPIERAPRRRIGLVVLTLFLLAIGLGIAIGGTWLWRGQQTLEHELARTSSEVTVSIESVRAAIADLEDRYAQIDERIRSGEREVETLRGQLDAVPGELAALQRRIDTVQGGSFDSRTSWLLAEAEYYLALANTELGLAGRFENAAVALRLADDRLRTIADPALAAVRSQIADELLAVESLRGADIEGLAFSLGRLAERAGQLALRGDPPERYENRAAGDDEAIEPGLGRLWETTKNAFSSIIRVERREEPVNQALTAAEKALVRRQLAVELQLTRLALLRGQQDHFDTSVANASELLRRDFDTESADVEAAAVLLDELREVRLSPPLPDISGSLRALRALGSGDG